MKNKSHKRDTYDHARLESRWRKVWEKDRIYNTETRSKKPKKYILDMFPYPSGEGLHVGHVKGYIATDVMSRSHRMMGYNVLHPMGFDAFGLPAENFAIKTKTHPSVAVKKNIAIYIDQLKRIGLDYDWSRTISTTDPEFYRWTQWTFLELYKRGLAEERFEPINWCPSCQTGLANEDLEAGNCERCGTRIEKKPMRQWVLRITDYAERLLADLDTLKNWPSSIVESQRHWIGKSTGMLFTAPVRDSELILETFSAHFHTFMADTFVVIAPDHPLLPQLVEGTKTRAKVLAFASRIVAERAKDGQGAVGKKKEISGIFTGKYLVDPVSKKDIPIWVASFAIADYGTGIVKCSAHDERDFAFAKKYDIPLRPVLFPADKKLAKKVASLEVCYTDMTNGILTLPRELKGRVSGEVTQDIVCYLESHNLAKQKTVYRLKDWVFSRQRYWGEPIPIIHCEKCGIVPVPIEDLPVLLPKVTHYTPTGTGESPLAAIDRFVNTKCPTCGGRAKRETNTMPQWAGSSWYYLRYIDPKNFTALVDSKLEKYWAPVDVYVGGADHATRHLIYARFWHKFLFDIGVVSREEPIDRLQNVGLISASDGRKMSKRWGNVINPNDIVSKWGADTLRVYEMFMGPFAQSVGWQTENMMGARRFIERIWRISADVTSMVAVSKAAGPAGRAAKIPKDTLDELQFLTNSTITKVTADVANFGFNTAISAMMVLSNAIEDLIVAEMGRTIDRRDIKILEGCFVTLLQLLAPFAPHITEELCQRNKYSRGSIHTSRWPIAKASTSKRSVTIAITVNGKLRETIILPEDSPESEVAEIALSLANVTKFIADKSNIKKTIFVPNKLINFVV